jgi:hypothetical protein
MRLGPVRVNRGSRGALKVRGDERDWVQRAYEVEIRRKSGVERVEVQRGESMLVPWVGRPLVSEERAKVHVPAAGVLG